MLKALYEQNLYPYINLDKVYKIKAHESARGIRFILKEFNDTSKLKFKHIIKIGNELYENEAVKFNEEESYVDVMFPALDTGIYQSELAIISGDKKLLSGIFEIEYTESLIGGDVSELKKKISSTDIFLKLLEAEKKVKVLLEKTESLTEIIDKNYVHDQIQSSTVWAIQHNLNKYPSVSVVDSGKNEVVGDINYIDKNNLVINFSHAFSGKAFLN